MEPPLFVKILVDRCFAMAAGLLIYVFSFGFCIRETGIFYSFLLTGRSKYLLGMYIVHCTLTLVYMNEQFAKREKIQSERI